MKKGVTVFFAIIILTAFPCMARAEGFDRRVVALSLSYSGDFNFLEQTADDAMGIKDTLFGIGLNVPLLFKGIDVSRSSTRTIYLMIEPMVSVEYSVFTDMLRIRTGAHFGKFHEDLACIGYYAGISGVFINDFANNAAAVGISPEIGFEWYLFFIGLRLQAQYDFYTAEKYNRFVFTISFTAIIAG